MNSFCGNSLIRKQVPFALGRVRKPDFKALALSSRMDYLLLISTEGKTQQMNFALSSYPWSGLMLNTKIRVISKIEQNLDINFSNLPVSRRICLEPMKSKILSLELRRTSLQYKNTYLGKVIHRLARFCSLTKKDMYSLSTGDAGWCTDPILQLSTEIHTSMFHKQTSPKLLVALPYLAIPTSEFRAVNITNASQHVGGLSLLYSWVTIRLRSWVYSHDKARTLSFQVEPDNGSPPNWITANKICHKKGLKLPMITDEDRVDALKANLVHLDNFLMLSEDKLLSISFVFIGLVLKVCFCTFLDLFSPWTFFGKYACFPPRQVLFYLILSCQNFYFKLLLTQQNPWFFSGK